MRVEVAEKPLEEVESDLLVVVGASFSNHTGIAPYKPIVQVDFDEHRAQVIGAIAASAIGVVARKSRPAAGCQIVTIGQYLRPSPKHLPIIRFVPPDEFARFMDGRGGVPNWYLHGLFG